MKLTILDGHAVNPGDLPWDKFSDLVDITVYERTPQELVINRIGDSDAILLNKVNITEEVFATCQNLKYVGVLATGYNVVDIEAAKRHKVTVTNIPSYSTNSVAQHVFSFILNFTNQVELHNNSVHNGEWITCPDFCYWKSPLMELSEKTLGVFGYGMIGKKVTEIAKAFGMNVICCTRTAQDGMPKSVTFEQMMQLSDIVTLHAPLTEKTKNIINKASLKLMKKSAYLINTARGGFVVEQELADCLNSGQIAGYAADVVSQEPMNKDSPLLTAKNCVITPHIAWSPLESRKRLQNIAYDNLKNFINGTPTNSITK
ncbi:D-2-hydroxyacid dehydrogenase [Treponema sp. Marseille-Q3903]|uniref:D-2-hydroxyacid dehydrogenase n=1 Tax=Treponema sp. Marseille-Q3903 TaxID=2766703 RepID=UPI001652084D|nr:D-2-hydroxyacid dehydrogenase [Treponema sp. Marseille-Q3903]MBC6713489.1 D-2-hydroxyacid dehydrogenase [Treponema sp. Marseille-Q3903]